MAYDSEKLVKVGHLKALAEKISGTYATQTKVNEIEQKVNELVEAGGEANVITAVKVNGTELAVTDKAVDISVPTEEDIKSAVLEAEMLTRKKIDDVESIDPSAPDADQYIYMVPTTNEDGSTTYTEYIVIEGEVVEVGNWEVDLEGYVQKEDGKGLSSNDFTDEYKTKLDSLTDFATKVEAGDEAGTIKVDGEDIIVVDIATDTEIDEMLNEVLGA